ncbi:MAG: hypothetical protein ACI4BI_06340 [Anaerotardibacter sp.]
MDKPVFPDNSWRRIDPDDRARQFMPFAALTGYYDLIKKREIVPEPKRVPSEERALELSRILSQLQKGDLVSVTHYQNQGYCTTTGVISEIDTTFRTIRVVKTLISLDDIWELKTSV